MKKVKIKDLSDEELIKIYKKRSSQMINALILINARENMEIVKELKQRGLFNNIDEEKQEKIQEELKRLQKENIEYSNESELYKLEKENRELQKEKEDIFHNFYSYLLIATVVGSIDKNEYFEKRGFDLSEDNIEELNNLYTCILNNLYIDFKTNDIKQISMSDIIDYSTKYLEKHYEAEENEDEEDEEPVEGMKFF